MTSLLPEDVVSQLKLIFGKTFDKFDQKEVSVRNHYINPMCDQGVLKRQYPNILNHPKQKYYSLKK